MCENFRGIAGSKQAAKAVSCPDAIFNNRFVMTYWAKHDITNGPRFQLDKSNDSRHSEPVSARSAPPSNAGAAGPSSYIYRNKDRETPYIAARANLPRESNVAKRYESKEANVLDRLNYRFYSF